MTRPMLLSMMAIPMRTAPFLHQGASDCGRPDATSASRSTPAGDGPRAGTPRSATPTAAPRLRQLRESPVGTIRGLKAVLHATTAARATMILPIRRRPAAGGSSAAAACRPRSPSVRPSAHRSA
jgi:hypothetical protein